MEKYIEIFNKLWEHSENEVVEFKKAETNFDIDELGKYFSALSNEANLRDHEFAWIVFGVWDKKHQIIGTTFKDGEVALNRLKQDMSQHTTGNLIFRDIVPLDIEGKRVLLFQIPASPRNIVMHWKGVAYGRDGESLKPLNQAKQDTIRQQPPIPDWTAQLVPNATINDLDELAVAQITWTWEDEEGIVQDYEHFTIPFILTVDKVLSKIRNKTMRELPGGTLFPDTMKQYDEYTIREALHNAIAHQDYTLQQRIVFVEGPSTLYYGNGGSFIPGTIENALEHKGPQFHYRNDCLCKGMVNFNMIDTVGRGIKKIYTEQRNRFFPMPDYDIDNEHRTVGVTIYGKMIDEKYTNLLKANNSLSLKECLWLDAVQKHHPITKEAAKHLHEKGLIEGRAPHYTISLKVAKMTKQIGHYTKENGLAENSIQKLLLQLAHNAGSMGFKRQDVYEGLQHVFPSSLTQDEKLRKIGNLLRKIAKEGFITKTISGKQWIITEKGEQESNY